MKILSIIAPVLKLIKHFGLLYRVIGIAGCFAFFSSSAKDLMFLSSAKNTEPMTIEQLTALPQSEIPRYLKLRDLTLLSESYVVTQDEESGTIYDASYPVYSVNQFANYDTLNPASLVAHVIIKDKDFDETKMPFMIDIDGKYDNDSFSKVRDLLNTNGVKVSEKAVLIVKEKPPAYKSTLLWTIGTGLLGLLIALSFIPRSMLGGKREEVDSTVPPPLPKQ